MTDDTLTDLRAKLRAAIVRVKLTKMCPPSTHEMHDCHSIDPHETILDAAEPVLAECAAEIQRLTEAVTTAERERDEARAAEKRCIQASVQVVTRAPLTTADIRPVGVCLHGSLRRQCETCDLADQLELADQRIATLTAERDDWRLSFETSNTHVGTLQAQVATLTARVLPELDKPFTLRASFVLGGYERSGTTAVDLIRAIVEGGQLSPIAEVTVLLGENMKWPEVDEVDEVANEAFARGEATARRAVLTLVRELPSPWVAKEFLLTTCAWCGASDDRTRQHEPMHPANGCLWALAQADAPAPTTE